ncbi:tryptophan-rich sensory protein [Lactiplantibacillus plantarum]|uniref:TspO/MBR family protein n=1 Tax=Lactiplantibacillus plantarum TaxID=1590 RepID=UPI0021A87744|nr:TspO/MBR family protein [Lactiplantibacillus plantarum]MCT3222755.1 tryptophan-rich sensory protein [Lactiplantibacillus plantarum]
MIKERPKFNWLHLLIFIVVVEAIGSLSAWLAGDIKDVYNGLNLPVLSPPDGLFGIVWPILYALIAIAGYLVFQQATTHRDRLMDATLFGIQLLLNFIWSIIFFSQSAYWWGLVIIIVLDLVVLLCILQFYRSSRLAAILMVPYLVWICFATYLTLGVALLN